MSKQSEVEKNINSCISDIVSALNKYKCGISIEGNGGALFVSCEYTGEDGKTYCVVHRAFEAELLTNPHRGMGDD